MKTNPNENFLRKAKMTGLVVFVCALALFTSAVFVGHFAVEKSHFERWSAEEGLTSEYFAEKAEDYLVGHTFQFGWQLADAVRKTIDISNRHHLEKGEFDRIIQRSGEDLAVNLGKWSAKGTVAEHKWLWLALTVFLGFFGALAYMLPDVRLLGGPGIKNNHVYHRSISSRGVVAWAALAYLVLFYLVLYFRPSWLTNLTLIADPVSEMISGRPATRWFVYGLLYCMIMKALAVRMLIKYRHNRYQIVRTLSVVFFQLIFAFLLVEIMPLFQLPAVDLKNAWPLDYSFLFDYRVKNLLEAGHAGKFIFVWGIVLTVIIVPTLTYFYGKRWYCSWVCGCGGLAETAGDPFRQHSDKSLKAWKLERVLVHAVLGLAIIMTIWTGLHTYFVLRSPDLSANAEHVFLGISSFDIRQWYGLLIGSWFSGVIGTGFYPIFGNRVWCRFGCPLAAYMGIVQRFKSRFRITTNGGQCISCGNCSTYCEMGIDVRAYAQRGQNIVRASCVGCGVCEAVCPRGVLKLENGPTNIRLSDNPILIGKDGAQLNL